MFQDDPPSSTKIKAMGTAQMSKNNEAPLKLTLRNYLKYNFF